jgi:DNA modification methylase
MFEANRILPGNNIDTLKKIPNGSVDCCVTSPPYYGLRDYGTAIWIGGDSACNHFRDNKIVDGDTFSSDYHPKGDMIYKTVCKKCGAIREDHQIGLEATPEEYIEKLITVFSEIRRVLKNTGTLWINIGDSYNGSGKNNGNTKPSTYKQSSNTASHATSVMRLKSMPPKSLIGIPWRFALAMMNDGWILRQDIIWSKPSVMPESVKDRFCKSHEYIFLFSKKTKYYFNHRYALEPATGYDDRKTETVTRGVFDQEVWGHESGTKRERWPQRGYITKEGRTGLSEQHHGTSIPTNPLRTKRDVWVVASEPSELNHYAMFPQKLILPCILCGCPENGIVLDPFLGSGTTAVVAVKNLRKYIGCEINPEYIQIAEQRIANEKGLFDD